LQWKHLSSPATKKFKIQPSARKWMMIVFWDSWGSILEYYQECRVTGWVEQGSPRQSPNQGARDH
jgi:hypothetical protein